MMLQPTQEEFVAIEGVDGEGLTLKKIREISTEIIRQLPALGQRDTLLRLMELMQDHNTSMNMLAFEFGGMLEDVKELKLYNQAAGSAAYENFEEWLKTSEIARYGYQQLTSWQRFYNLVKRVENFGLDFLPILEYATPLSSLKMKHVERLVRSMEMSWNEIGRRRASKEEKLAAVNEVRKEINQEILSVLESSEEALYSEAIARLKNTNEMEPHALFLKGVRHEGHEFIFELHIPDDRRVWEKNLPANKVRFIFELPNDPEKQLRSPKDAFQYLDEEIHFWPDTVEGSVEEDAS